MAQALRAWQSNSSGLLPCDDGGNWRTGFLSEALRPRRTLVASPGPRSIYVLRPRSLRQKLVGVCFWSHGSCDICGRQRNNRNVDNEKSVRLGRAIRRATTPAPGVVRSAVPVDAAAVAAAKTRQRVSKLEKRLRVVLGRNVRAQREHQGLTVEAAATAAGIGPRTWQKIEAGDVGATLKMVANLATALDIDPLDLFEPPPDD